MLNSTVEAIKETDMETVSKAAVSVSEQINLVISNIAEKLEAPAGAIKEVAQFGFEKYVDYISAYAIGSIITDIILFILSVVFIFTFIKLSKDVKNNHMDKANDVDVIGFIKIIIATILIILSFSFMGNVLCSINEDYSKAIAPEGYVIKEIIDSQIRKE